MWLLRRKSSQREAVAEVLPPAAGPMRRIEITVERHWVSRLASAATENGAEVLGEQKPRQLPKDLDA
jgi:hypothetical protein